MNKCNMCECFAYTEEEENCCKALDVVDVTYCPFYKTGEEMQEQRKRLVLNGKIPVGEAITQQQKALYTKGDLLTLWLLQEKS